MSHIDVFVSILQDRQAVHTSGSLQELFLATGIICNMALTEAVLTVDAEELGQEQIQLRGPLARIQRLMVGLLPRYCNKENWEKVCCIALWYRYHLTRLQRNLFHFLDFLVFSDANDNPNAFLANVLLYLPLLLQSMCSENPPGLELLGISTL